MKNKFIKGLTLMTLLYLGGANVSAQQVSYKSMPKLPKRTNIEIFMDNFRSDQYSQKYSTNFYMGEAKYPKRMINMYEKLTPSEQKSVEDKVDDAYFRLGELYFNEAERLKHGTGFHSDVVEKAKRARGYFQQIGKKFPDSELAKKASEQVIIMDQYLEHLNDVWQHRFEVDYDISFKPKKS